MVPFSDDNVVVSSADLLLLLFCLQVACVVVIIVIAISLLFCKQSALFLSKTLYHPLYRIHNPDPLIKSLTMDTGSIVADLKRNKNAFKSSLINERVSCWCVYTNHFIIYVKFGIKSFVKINVLSVGKAMEFSS